MMNRDGLGRGFLVFGLFVVGLFGVGCSSALVGTWEVKPIPQDMEFYIVSAEFKENGDYRATARVAGGDSRNLRGKYEFNGFTLKLMRPGAAPREYPAKYYITGMLEIQAEGGTQRLEKR